MRRETSDFRTKITLSPKAKAQVEKGFIERTIAEAWGEVEGHVPCYEGRAEFAVDALNEAGFEIVRKKAGRVVVLDEAGERKLQDLISGKSVPTGRIVEVTYRNPDGTTRTQRHAEFGSLDKVSYDPQPVVGSEIAGATVLKAPETVKLEPGKPDTETEKAAGWARVLIKQILGDEGKLQAEGGFDEAGRAALSKLVAATILRASEEDRWEVGFRNIVTALHGPRYSFEIDQIVEEVRTLTGIVSRLPDESLRRTEHHSFGEDDPFTTISGDTSSVECILDLIEKGEAAVKADLEEKPRGYVWTQKPKETVEFVLVPGMNAEIPAGMELEPGRTAGFPSGLRDDVGILGGFYSDGIISFAGDCNDMVAFRDMAAKVVGVPGSRGAA